MYFSRLRNRGFTISAALIFVGLLVFIAVAVQSTVPAVTSPASLTAPSEATQVAAVAQSSVLPGFDVITVISQPEQTIYFAVCPADPKFTSKNKMDQVFAAVRIAIPKNGGFGDRKDRCKEQMDNDNQNRLLPNGTWQQKTLFCNPKAPQTSQASSLFAPPIYVSEETIASEQSKLRQGLDPSLYECGLARITTLSSGTNDSQQLREQLGGSTVQPAAVEKLVDEISNTTNPQAIPPLVQGLPTDSRNTVSNAFAKETSELETEKQMLQSRDRELEQEWQAITVSSNCWGLPQEANCGEDTSRIENINKEREEIATQILKKDQEIKNLKMAQVALNITSTRNGEVQNSNQVLPQIPGLNPLLQTRALPSFGNTFSNPVLGANNIPVSPFGGSCATRYICSGGVLYYQSSNLNPVNGYMTTQCQTQVVQRCAYGCASLSGGNSASNGLGGVMSVIGGLFGGNSAANTNASNSCAYSSQSAQTQNPLGLGDLGKLLFGGDDDESQTQSCPRAPSQPDASQCTSGSWRPTSAMQNGCTTGWQCVSSTGGGASNPKPTAQLTCTPQIVESGSPVKLNFTCGNSTASRGTGFDTGGAPSGTATAVASPPEGENLATYTLTCLNQSVTTSAQCRVQINKSQIILVTNPSKVTSGETSLIGWITSGMKSCTVSSLEQQDFTTRNAGNTSVNGAATTSPITGLTHFQLDCQTHSGTIKTAVTTVSLK